eukprot:1503146-Amphidinium_carterae.4
MESKCCDATNLDQVASQKQDCLRTVCCDLVEKEVEGLMVLDEQFISKCREAFNTFDQDGSGTIDTQEMKLLLEAIGETPTEEELFRFMADVDEDGTGEIEFAEFLRAFEKQRGGQQDIEDESDTLDAFVALGGSSDKTGFIDTARLVRVVKEDFSMTIKIERLIEELDKDKDGKLNYSEFAALFIANAAHVRPEISVCSEQSMRPQSESPLPSLRVDPLCVYSRAILSCTCVGWARLFAARVLERTKCRLFSVPSVCPADSCADGVHGVLQCSLRVELFIDTHVDDALDEVSAYALLVLLHGISPFLRNDSNPSNEYKTSHIHMRCAQSLLALTATSGRLSHWQFAWQCQGSYIMEGYIHRSPSD